MAEAVFRHHASSSPLSFSTIDSAGTGGYHLLAPPDSRTISTLKSHSIPCHHAARQVHDKDFTTFDYVLAMDDENLDVLLAMRARVVKKLGLTDGDRVAVVRLFGDYSEDGTVCKEIGGGEVVPDPYYGARGGFEGVYQQLTSFSRGFLIYLARKQEGEME
jgi:low molecular weight phosphotyrosine protein phosphatase